MPTDHRQRRHTLWLLCALSFILYVDRVNLATAAGAIKAELGLSNTELGIAFSAFAYSYAICQIGGGWIADRFGARITLIGCGLIWVASTFMTGLVHSLALLFAARLLLGIGEGATLPAQPARSRTGSRANGAASCRASRIRSRGSATRSRRRSSPR
jgi:MFS family permease